jgi:hypothetical protein
MLHQYPTNLATHCGAEMTSCHILLIFNLSSLQRRILCLKLSTNTPSLEA